MTSASNLTRLVDELAGLWTEPALEILKAAGIQRVSLDMELESWRTLKGVLRAELRWQQALRLPTLVSLSTLMEKVLRKATLYVARTFEPRSFTYAFESRIRRLTGERRSTPAERRLYAGIVRQPRLRAAFKPPSRTDFTPRLQVSALAR
jgi:hypothetical protein